MSDYEETVDWLVELGVSRKAAEASLAWTRAGVDREVLAAEHARVRRSRMFRHDRYASDPPTMGDHAAADVTLAFLATQPTPAPVDADAVERVRQAIQDEMNRSGPCSSTAVARAALAAARAGEVQR